MRILSITSRRERLPGWHWCTYRIVDQRLCPHIERQLRRVQREIRRRPSLSDECRLDRSRCGRGTMRHFAVALLTVCALSFFAVLADEGQYTTKFDNVDVDAIINSERLLNGYVGCLLDRNPCTPDAAELKKNLPDALEHDCAGCSAAQKNAADKISHHLIDNKPDDWKLLEEKYDPTGAYRRRYLENKGSKESSSRFD